MIKKYYKYEKYLREELIDELETLKKKKYGLVWDKKNSQEMLDAFVNWENVPENFTPKQFPVLKEVKNKEIENDKNKPVNLLIEGDNYHSLAVLNFTHQNAIDVIYIDPPYNTGNKDFIYNDKFIDKEDPFRHSKWLSFMDKRLRLAHRLLKNTGIIFISIDDNEQAQLRLLCDEIFGENNFITNIIWQSKTGASDAKTIDTTTEYILVYVKSEKGKKKFSRNKFSYEEKRYHFKDKYEKDRGTYYPDNLDRGGLRYSDSLNYSIICPDGTKTYPNGRTEFINDGWTWKWGNEKVQWGIKNGYIEFKKTKKKKSGWAVYYKNYMFADNEGNPIERSAPQKNIITDIKTGEGAIIIKELFGYQLFKYSKPVQLIKRILNYVDFNKDSTVLDFMAGSGTAGQAVMELNNEDELNLKFILCTNDEELDNNGNSKKHKICSDICYPRVEKVINGYKNSKGEKVVGLGGNLKYFKTDFVGSDSTDKNKRDLVNKSAEMICIKEDIFDLVADGGLDYRIYQKGKKFLGVIFDIDAIVNFKKEAEKHKGNFVVYCFSYVEEIPKKEFTGLKNKYVFEPIPAVILKVYEEIFNKKVVK